MREFGSDFPLNYGPNTYFEKISKYKSHCVYLRSGREAISLIIESLMLTQSDTVLLPAYCCRSMDDPFILKGVKVEYYRLNEDLSVNIKYLTDCIVHTTPRLIMTMNYYGFTDTGNCVDTIKKNHPSITIIEDFSHCLFTFDQNFNPNVDYYFASIRKSIGIFDGGICMSNHFVDSSIIRQQETLFTSKRVQSSHLKALYQYSYDQELKNKSKSLFREAENNLDEYNGEIYRISETSLTVIRNTDVELYKYAREENYQHLYKCIKNITGIEILFAPTIKNHSPFAMPILFKERETVQTILGDTGIYAPVLWTIKNKAKVTCPISKKISENMLAIPIDQRFDYWDIEEIGERINNCIK